MKNKILLSIVGLIAIIGIAFIVLTFTIDGIVKSAIEENGTELFQTEVNVNNVDISLINGTGEINGLVIQNPEGFSGEPAIQIDVTNIRIDLVSIFSDTIVVENVTLQNPELFFEQRGVGINLRKLNQNMDLDEDVEGPFLVIDHLLIENGTVKVSSTMERERTAEASIEEFELNNVGRAGNNTVKQSMREIMDPLIQRAIQEAISRGLLEQLENKVQDLLGGENED